MPWFEYEGVTSGGTAIAGKLEAANQPRAMDALGGMMVDVRSLREAAPPAISTSRLGSDDLIFLNEQLASLAEAGIALEDGLRQLARDISSPRLRIFIERLAADLSQGVPLDQAVARHERGLPLLYGQVLKAGVQSGNLPATLFNLNQHLRLQAETRRMLWDAAAYPLMVLGLSVALVALFMLFLVPQFKDIFVDFGASLPGSTLLLISTSEWLTDGTPPGWAILLAIVGLLIAGCYMLRLTPGGRNLRESIQLSLPIMGRIVRSSLVARFSRAVATTVGAGVPLPQSIRLAAGATGSGRLMRDAEYVAGEVERGQSIYVACQSTQMIPALFGYSVQVARGREALPASLAQLARAFEHRAIHSQGMIRALLFPLMVLALGIIMGFMVSAMFLPLVHLVNAVSGG